MNSQIRRLAVDSGLGFERWNSTEQFEAFLDKFAKSIIKECAKVADSRPSVLIDQTTGGFIKEHFGVK